MRTITEYVQRCHIQLYQKIARKKVARVNAALKVFGEIVAPISKACCFIWPNMISSSLRTNKFTFSFYFIFLILKDFISFVSTVWAGNWANFKECEESRCYAGEKK